MISHLLSGLESGKKSLKDWTRQRRIPKILVEIPEISEPI
jgi:hypothetical protein